MKNILKVFVEVAVFCMITGVFLPIESFAQNTKPQKGKIYYYKETDKTAYCAVQFFDGSIKVVSSEKNMTLSEFKSIAPKKLTEMPYVKETKSSNENKKVYEDCPEDIYWCYTYEFTQNYKTLVEIIADIEGGFYLNYKTNYSLIQN